MIKKGLIRASIPFIIFSIISVIMILQKMHIDLVKSTFLSGLIVSLLVGTSVIYDVERWSLKKQSIIHFLFMLVTVYPILLISGWFKLKDTIDYLRVFAFFILIGIVLWSIIYLIFAYFLGNKYK
ncbi:MAG: DUF3021 family protein [Anaerococcus sp.]|nr:DUF3021 family protein [Anaerococcus sp.]